jgi:signal transduction histidine kinase
LLVLIVAAMLTTSHKAQAISLQVNQLNAHHQKVDAELRQLRSDVNLSGIFVRDYLLDISRKHAPEYRQRLEEFRKGNVATLADLRTLALPHDAQIGALQDQLDAYWAAFDPLFDWTINEKIYLGGTFLRQQVVPRRDAIIRIAQEIEELNNANLAAQRAEVTRRQAAFRSDLNRLMWQCLLLGLGVALTVVFRLRVLERRSVEQRLLAQQAERELRQLSQRLVATQEEERRHLSRELHDHVGQVLTALRMELGRIERGWAATDARLAGAVAETKQLVDTMFRTVRDLALGLRPSMLDDLGLRAALEWYIRDTSRRFGVDIQLTIEGDVDTLPDRYQTCVYRVIQEALTNGLRHAKAHRIGVTLAARGGALDIAVADDGAGFDSAQRREGLGLRGIDERVKELGGQMTITSASGRGTMLAVQMPLPTPNSEVPLARIAG